MNTGDMEKYCPKPHPVYFNAFSMWQQLSGSVQYLIIEAYMIDNRWGSINENLHYYMLYIMCINLMLPYRFNTLLQFILCTMCYIYYTYHIYINTLYYVRVCIH